MTSSPRVDSLDRDIKCKVAGDDGVGPDAAATVFFGLTPEVMDTVTDELGAARVTFSMSGSTYTKSTKGAPGQEHWLGRVRALGAG
ncbi:hypothetical protein PC110_g557 [Phytophthora cactorum]|uniref:Uncharacterized protein n=1 Tax=Phytophthora cactorum TaxID=29920 RepID=A0A329T1T9_9STRA|nr:hypothetical protein PC110_g557 [Phytophthora cactorum]